MLPFCATRAGPDNTIRWRSHPLIGLILRQTLLILGSVLAPITDGTDGGHRAHTGYTDGSDTPVI